MVDVFLRAGLASASDIRLADPTTFDAGRQDVLSAGSLAFGIAAPALSLVAFRICAGAAGALAFSGSAAGLRATRVTLAGSGAVALISASAALQAARVNSVGVAAFPFAGQAARLTGIHIVAAAATATAIAAPSAAIKTARVLAAAQADISFVAPSAVLSPTTAHMLAAGSSAIAIAAPPASLYETLPAPPRVILGGRAWPFRRLRQRADCLIAQPARIGMAGDAVLRSTRVIAGSGQIRINAGVARSSVDRSIAYDNDLLLLAA